MLQLFLDQISLAGGSATFDLLQTMDAGPVIVSRMPMQDFSAIHAYLTQDMWQQAAEKGQESFAKSVMQLCCNLGMRSPSEVTLGHLTAVTICAVEGTMRAVQMASLEKFHLLKAVKIWWRQFVQGPQPAEVMRSLPLNPEQFRLQCPLAYAAAFANGAAPSMCPFALHDILVVRSSIPLRSNNLTVQPSQSARQKEDRSKPHSHPPAGQMQDFMLQMMQCMMTNMGTGS